MYNSSQTIIRAIESVKNQTYSGQVQILIVDDGSTDNSVTLVEDFKKANRSLWIDLFKKENEGVSIARNLAMDNAKGNFFAFLDSDDVWLENKLEVQLSVLNSNSEIDLIGCTANGLIITKVLGRDVGSLIHLSPFRYVIKSLMSTPSVLFRREVYDKVGGFDESFKYAEDLNYWLKCMKYFNCYVLNEPLIYVESNVNLKNSGGLSSKLWEMEKGVLKNIKFIYEEGQINFIQYYFSSIFSFIKFIRRTIIYKIT